MLGFLDYYTIINEVLEEQRLVPHSAILLKNKRKQGAQVTARSANPMSRVHPSEIVHKIPMHKLSLNEPGKFNSDTHSDESENHIQNLTHNIKRGNEVDPITVMHKAGKLHVVDGHHRIEAHLRAGKKHINAQVIGRNGQKVKYVKDFSN